MIYLLGFLVCFLYSVRWKRQKGVVAFFHPYCNAGGGGERVLWCAIRSMQQRWPELSYVVYSGDTDASKEQILLKAKQRFGIEIDPKNVSFVFLRLRRLVEADLYPVFTMIAQALAGGILALEALMRLNPEVLIDSMGYPLALPVFKWFGGSKVAAYVHYPTISCDMIDLVSRREATYNNKSVIASSSLLSTIKLFYYKMFAFGYGMAGRACDVVMTNSSWTHGHISRLWWCPDAKIVFPPCDVTAFTSIEPQSEEILKSSSSARILSIGQIRPEKNHRLQIDALVRVREMLEKEGNKGVKVLLTIAGGCRHEDDKKRVKELQKYAEEQGVAEFVDWKLNIPFDELLELLTESLISIHTMRNEHFGISVVEGMAAGTIMLANDSAGPSMDIVVAGKSGKEVGFLASSVEEYASCLLRILSMTPEERQSIRESARERMPRFGEEAFEKEWNQSIQKVIE